MRNLWPLLLLVIAFVAWNRSCSPLQQARSGSSGARVAADARPGGPVRDLQRQPSDIMDMQGAMPQPQGGSSSKAMLDAARGAQR